MVGDNNIGEPQEIGSVRVTGGGLHRGNLRLTQIINWESIYWDRVTCFRLVD